MCGCLAGQDALYTQHRNDKLDCLLINRLPSLHMFLWNNKSFLSYKSVLIGLEMCIINNSILITYGYSITANVRHVKVEKPRKEGSFGRCFLVLRWKNFEKSIRIIEKALQNEQSFNFVILLTVFIWTNL
jgi:hypothetical protein